MKSRKKMLIVDGYNVLRSGSRYKRISLPDYTDDTFNVARERLLNDVMAFAGNTMQAVIVFDGTNNEYSRGEAETIGNVRIIFSPTGQMADRVIEKLAHDAKERGVEALVVTSDSTIQDTVFGGGVDRMSAEGFCREMAERAEAAKADKRPEVAYKNTIADRVPPEVLEKLKQIRDA